MAEAGLGALSAAAEEVARRARAASQRTAELGAERKDAALRAIADALETQAGSLLEVNRGDLEAGRAKGLAPALLDRLRLTPQALADLAQGLRDIAALPDPVGTIERMWTRPSGLRVGRMRIPLGAILVIYESRPGVTIEVAGLCLKAGNATLLRGGSEAQGSNRALAALVRAALSECGLPPDAVQLVDRPERELIDLLLEREDDLDLVIPRGGEALIRRVSERSRIPVIKHYKGVCHVYVDRDADPKMAVAIAINSKCQRLATCNTAETLLVHAAHRERLLPDLVREFLGQGVEIRGCERTRQAVTEVVPATEDDWREEYLDRILAVRVVDSLDQAVDHIRRYGSNHTESIVTDNLHAAHEFVRRVNSSAVFVNASTRLADGFQLGLGAEVGVSTTKLHWYGPMGVEGLTTLKFIAFGEGQLRE